MPTAEIKCIVDLMERFEMHVLTHSTVIVLTNFTIMRNSYMAIYLIKESSKLPIYVGAASVQLNVCRIGQQSTFVLPCPNDDMGRVMTCRWRLALPSERDL